MWILPRRVSGQAQHKKQLHKLSGWDWRGHTGHDKSQLPPQNTPLCSPTDSESHRYRISFHHKEGNTEKMRTKLDGWITYRFWKPVGGLLSLSWFVLDIYTVVRDKKKRTKPKSPIVSASSGSGRTDTSVHRNILADGAFCS